MPVVQGIEALYDLCRGSSLSRSKGKPLRRAVHTSRPIVHGWRGRLPSGISRKEQLWTRVVFASRVTVDEHHWSEGRCRHFSCLKKPPYMFELLFEVFILPSITNYVIAEPPVSPSKATQQILGGRFLIHELLGQWKTCTCSHLSSDWSDMRQRLVSRFCNRGRKPRSRAGSSTATVEILAIRACIQVSLRPACASL